MVLQQQQQHPQLISHHDALSRFDTAVANSQVTYSPTTPDLLTDNGFKFQFRICPQLSQKPQLPPVDNSETTNSDISQPLSLHLTTVLPSHKLTINAYPILRPSYLLLTASSLQRQSSPLSLADIAAAFTVLASLSSDTSRESNGKEYEKGDYMVIYNSGRASGCSRFHKHMQILPRPFPLFPDRLPDGPAANVPYVYDLIRHPPTSPSTSTSDETLTTILTAYTSALQRFRGLLGLQSAEEPVPHNVVMTSEWTVVIPRRAASVEGLGANAAGMMGLVWVGTREELNEWERRGPWTVLGSLGVEAGRETD